MNLPSMIKGWLRITYTPEELLTQYGSTGDKHFLALLVEQFNLALFHYLTSLSDRHTAEDVLQTTWLKVMNKQSLNVENKNVKSWLFTIARNTLLDELKRTQRWQWQELDDQDITTKNMVSELVANDRLALFNKAIEQLPFHQREAFIFQQEGFALIEIAQMTNESFETVKSRLRYARNHLKVMLGATND